jgi:hypothetical protein
MKITFYQIIGSFWKLVMGQPLEHLRRRSVDRRGISTGRLAPVLLFLLFAACQRSEPPEEGLMIGDPEAGFAIPFSSIVDQFVLLPGGQTRVAAKERGVVRDSPILRADVDDVAVAQFEDITGAVSAVRLKAVARGRTTIRITTRSGKMFAASLVVEEAGPSEILPLLSGTSACGMGGVSWFDLRPIISERGLVYDASTFPKAKLSLGAIVRTRANEHRTGWGGVTFTSSEPGNWLSELEPTAFYFGLERVEFVDTRVVQGPLRGPATFSVGDARVSIEVTENPPFDRIRYYPVRDPLRGLAYADKQAESAPVTLSRAFLGSPRECVDLIVVPVDVEGRPIFGSASRTSVVSGADRITVRSHHSNHLALVGREIGNAEVHVQFGAQSISIPVSVVPSTR